MANIYLYGLEPNPNDIRLRDPTTPIVTANFSGNSNGNSSCSATFAGVRLVAGNSAGASTASATFAGVRVFAGGSQGSSSSSASFNGVRRLIGGSSGGSSLSASFNGAKLCTGSSVGNSDCSATLQGQPVPPPPPPPVPGSGGSVDFGRRYVTPHPKRSPAKDVSKPAKDGPKQSKRKKPKAKPDFEQYWNARDEYRDEKPAKQPLGARGYPILTPHKPGVGLDVINALMAILEALEAEPDVNGQKEEFFQSTPEEDIELVMLADEIT